MVAAAAAAAPAPALSVPVPAGPLAKGTVIQAADLTSRTLPGNQVFVSTVQMPAQAIGRQTTRALPAGVPISTLHLRQPPVVSRGSVVDFRFARGGVQLQGTAQALEDGVAGQSIRLLNPATRATLVGVVQPGGLVLVN
ncbi:MAG: flagellar basal body P-ring formation protein FlgA [Alphaproteobacteria bacterium]|nr:flagellar basal body P-ring formation protein FlgA [Alphaproteobacteria bacterium]